MLENATANVVRLLATVAANSSRKREKRSMVLMVHISVPVLIQSLFSTKQELIGLTHVTSHHVVE